MKSTLTFPFITKAERDVIDANLRYVHQPKHSIFQIRKIAKRATRMKDQTERMLRWHKSPALSTKPFRRIQALQQASLVSAHANRLLGVCIAHIRQFNIFHPEINEFAEPIRQREASALAL